MRHDTIVGYTYNAENLCPACGLEAIIRTDNRPPSERNEDVETVLDRIAREDAIDREDESSFDSSAFPKVIFAIMIDDGERCDSCGAPLIG